MADITVHIPSALRDYCGGTTALAMNASTINDLLSQIKTQHPRLYPNVCDETGSVRRHLNFFVNETHIRDLNGLDTRLAANDAVILLTAVSGG